MYFQLTDQFEVSADAEATWRFFSSADNLPKITPPWLKFTIAMDGPIEIKLDSILDYTIRWKGLPIKWRTKIIDWSPPRQFIDLQIRGPYALWHHQHTFTPSAGGVICADRVIYEIPFGPLGVIAHALTVRSQLIEIFQFRREAIGGLLGRVRAIEPGPRIRSL